MSYWLRIFTITSGVLCLIAILALCYLASQTTEVSKTASQPVAAWPQLPPSTVDQGAGLRLLINLLPLLTDDGSTIAGALSKFNKSAAAVPNELELTFKTPAALQAFLGRAAAEGLTVLNADPRLLSARVRYADPTTMAQELSKHAGDYENAAPNYLVWIPGLPAESPQLDTANAGGREPFGNSGMQAIGASADRSTWGRGMTLAILDTGIQEHPSLSQTQVIHYDLVNDGLEPNGHGTAMASLAVGSGVENGGAAQAAKVLDIRVADPKGVSDTALLAQAIMKAVDEGASVINISMGTSGDSLMLKRAVDYALSHGVAVVAAAGNDQQTMLAYPAGYPGVVSVGAVDANGAQAYFSNSGPSLTIAAPGVGIISAYSKDRIVIGSGTSQAAAITSGVVTTLLGWGYSQQGMIQTLTTAAQPTGAPREQVGAGLLHVPAH